MSFFPLELVQKLWGKMLWKRIIITIIYIQQKRCSNNNCFSRISSSALISKFILWCHQSSAIYIARQGMRIFCGTAEFFYLLLGCPTANFALLLRGQSHQLDVNNCMFDSLIQSKSHMEPRNEVGSQSLAKHLVGFEPRTFWFWM